MKVLIRDIYDPFQISGQRSVVNDQMVNTRGAINVIDLANIHSCSFIATDDLGTIHPDCSFEVSGRLDNSDIRGCNLMVV